MSLGITGYELSKKRDGLMKARIKSADIKDLIAALERMDDDGRAKALMTFVNTQDLTNIGAAIVVALETLWARDVDLDVHIWASETEEARTCQEEECPYYGQKKVGHCGCSEPFHA